MTTQTSDEPSAGFGGRPRDEGMTATTVLRATRSRIRRDPIPVVLFVAAGLVVAVADWLRRWDPIPTARPAHFDQSVSIQQSVFPRGLAQSVRPVEALVDLRTPYFVGAIALELLVVLVIGLAGWITITRLLDVDRGIGSFARYQGVLSAVLLVPWVLGSPTVEFGNLLFGLVALVVVLLIWIRLFLFPGYLAAGYSVLDALRRSLRETRAMQSTLLVLVIILGVACWGLAQVPTVGGFLTTVVIALVHAVAIAVVLEWTEESTSDRPTEIHRPTRL